MHGSQVNHGWVHLCAIIFQRRFSRQIIKSLGLGELQLSGKL